MKRLAVIFCFALLLCGCGKESKDDVIKDFKNNINNSKSYKVTGNMEISNDEETFTYSLESYYLKDNYYKVILVNQTNNHEQIILKNQDDIYVITPALNKSFKFQSEWPDNSSQAYLLGSILKDVEDDADSTLLESDKGYVIKSKVNYPNNAELTYQKIYLNNKKIVEKVEVYNANDIVKIKVNFENVDLKAGLNKNDFKLEDYVKEEEPKTEEKPKKEPKTCEDGQTCENKTDTTEQKQDQNNQTETTTENTTDGDANTNTNTQTNTETDKKTTSIENIIYPLYIPSNTYLTSSEKVETATGNRVILTFSGEKNFVLIEEATIANDSMEIVPVYGEPLFLSETIGALSANSLSWDVNNISYYLASTELTVAEMQLIANSLGNETLVANTK